jgi:hypothetical protein
MPARQNPRHRLSKARLSNRHYTFSALGMLRKNWRNRKIWNGLPMNAGTRVTPFR